MKIQVNSDNTIAVDASLTGFVEGEISRVLGRFAMKLTRVEVHLSDVDSRKTGQADKRCLIEVRPAGAQPLSASAKATMLASAVHAAARKMQRLLTTFLGRKGRRATTASAAVSTSKKTAAKKTTLATKKSAPVKPVQNAELEKPPKLRARGPKKKGIYQARRKSWPSR